MSDIPTIETPRFRLRAARRDDFDEYARMWADERTTRFIGGAPRDRTTSWAKFLAMPGLWAIGSAAASVTGPAVPAPGVALAEAMVYGRAAAASIAAAGW